MREAKWTRDPLVRLVSIAVTAVSFTVLVALWFLWPPGFGLLASFLIASLVSS